MTRKQSQRELEQLQKNLEYTWWELKVFVADIISPGEAAKEAMEDRMIELENLVNTYGGVVILKHIQNKTSPDYNTFIWEGRLDDIIEEMKREGANVLIFWNILKPQQIYKINDKLRSIWAKAWDRVDLILKIFEKNANSREAKLQIELAAIKHMWPRIFGMGMDLSKQWAGTWTRGKWETNTEIMKRHLRKKEEHIKKELDHFKKVRAQHRQWRTRKGLHTAWVVGYTNAWKSTLTNTLTNKWVLAEDKLFATLWTSVWKMWLPTEDGRGKEVLINDTIWFIRDLPPNLIDAFSSTLEDSIESQILLHVIDANDPKLWEKIEVVEDILTTIWAKQKRIYVFNKIDDLSSEEFEIENWEWEIEKYSNKLDYLREVYTYLEPVFISAGKKIWLQELKDRIVSEL